jgi:endonuclease I
MKKRSGILLSVSTALTLCLVAIGTVCGVKTKEAKAAAGNYTDVDASTFYSTITGTTSSALLGQLHDLMTTKHRTYTTYNDNGSGELQVQTDYDPNDSTKVLDFYSRDSLASGWNPNSVDDGYNREHVWCQSLSNGMWGEDGAGGDIHHIRPEVPRINSTRNNHPYGVVSDHSTTALYHKTGNQSLAGWVDSSYDAFEPTDGVKGDVARILMYVYVHYNTPTSLGAGTGTSSYYGTLPITNIVRTSAGTTSAAWALLTSWNASDAVDAYETRRNEAAAKMTGTRNPFIDHPEYATTIWGGDSIKTLNSISISGTATKLSYTAGQTFDSTGLTVTANYGDGSTSDVTSSATWTPNPLTTGTTQVTCTYGGKTDTYSGITVVADTTPSFALSVTSKSLTVGTSGTVSYTASNFGSGLSVSISTSPSSSVATASLSSTTGSGTLTITPVAAGSTSLVLTADDGATAKTATLSITVSEASSGGLPTTSTDYPGTYTLCTSAADLTVGGKYMLVVSPTAGNYAMGSTLSGGYYNNVNVTLSNNSFTHTATDGGLPLILGGASGAWTFYDPINLGYLGCTAAKTITHSGTELSTWTISFENSKATIAYSNSAYGSLQYNASSPRFTTYTSAQTLPALYMLSEAATKTLSSISATGPTKTTYYVGDTFNTTGLSVTAHYSDSTTAAVTSYTTSIANGATLAASDTSCTVSYTEGGVTKTANIALTINAVELTSIAVTAPTKTTYTVNETLDTTGVVVTASYNNGSSAAVTGYTTDPANGATLSSTGNQNVTVSYTEGSVTKTGSFAITVNGAQGSVTLSSIEVTTQPTKTVYTVGDTFDTTGLVVTAAYSDNTTADVTSSCTLNPLNGATLSTAGSQTVVVSCNSLTTNFAVTVNAATSTGVTKTITKDSANMPTAYTTTASSFVLEGITMSLTNVAYYSASGADIQFKKSSGGLMYNTSDDGAVTQIVIVVNRGSAPTIYTGSSSNPTSGSITPTSSSSTYTYTFPSGTHYYSILNTTSSAGGYTSIAITYAGSSSDSEAASNWAATFVTTMSGICANTQANSTASTSLVNAWASQYSAYSSLSSAAKTLVASTTTTDTNIQAAQAKYIYILNKYGTASFTSGNYLGLTISSGAYVGVTKADSSESVAILVVSLMLAAGLAGFYFLRKKKAI